MEIEQLADQVGQALKQRGLTLATAESCTGGWVAQAITSVVGSSDWFERGFITYSNLSKQELLGLDTAVLTSHGAVSEAVARAMAEGARDRARTKVALAVTGIAGPSGGSTEKPVGTVWFAWAGTARETVVAHFVFSGDRTAIRRQAVVAALEGLLRFL